MNIQWLLVIIASVFEVGWATGLKYADTFTQWSFTVVAIIVSFMLLIRAATQLPTSTVYAVFVALGTAGTVMVDYFFFGAEMNVGTLLFLLLLLIGVIGLKVVTGDSKEQKEGVE
ncbi:multidrug efflux SMR transporter [Geomicrobium sp. JSM 1781026]|uniref:DMT family transporter n=1 Tax=unclassified Geomicrobium TaxID=2628951 RepID=UPI00045F4B07|nr:multidrug efflux SMR transporter [Geomicrobium sp. JCM 19039]GAK10655.1 quaternary ammonium compound-resistance protein SugE [Geomicrobium sp. JCM 19039]